MCMPCSGNSRFLLIYKLKFLSISTLCADSSGFGLWAKNPRGAIIILHLLPLTLLNVNLLQDSSSCTFSSLDKRKAVASLTEFSFTPKASQLIRNLLNLINMKSVIIIQEYSSVHYLSRSL